MKQGLVVFGAMFVLWLAIALVAMLFEASGNPKLTAAGANQTATATQAGGNMEGKETRFGPAASRPLRGVDHRHVDRARSTRQHDSFTPLGGAVPLVNIMLGEVDPGGTGSGLYGMLIFALLVGVHRRPHGRANAGVPRQEDPGRRDEARRALHPVRAARDPRASPRHLDRDEASARTRCANTGPHGLTEMTYAFTSQANNNGSAFGGLTGNTDWFNITGALAMLVGRFLLMIPVLAIAGSLGRKQPTPASAGTFPTDTPLFAALLTGVVVIVVGLTYFPVVALGPVVEHLVGKF